MDNEHRQHAAELYALIVGSTNSTAWTKASAGSAQPPQWQKDVIARILALTYDQEIQYLSTALPDGQDWDIVAITNFSVVRVLVVRQGDQVSRIESFAFPRSSLESLELLDVASIPDSDEIWPAELTLVGHYRSATLSLPLDTFASPGNKRDLVRLLTTLLQDLDH